ncbi:MAG: two-component system LytT family response regulator [Psychromonas sp.]
MTKQKAEDIKPENILFLEAQINYTYIHTSFGKFIFAKTLKCFEDSLDSKKFIRTHQSHIINRIHVKSTFFTGTHGVIKLKSGKEIHVSRRRIKEVKYFFDKL